MVNQTDELEPKDGLNVDQLFDKRHVASCEVQKRKKNNTDISAFFTSQRKRKLSVEINSNSEDVLTKKKDDKMTGACIQVSEEINSNSEDVLTTNKDDEMTGACIQDFIEIPQNSLDLDHVSEPSGTTNNVEITNSKEKNESILEISEQTEQLNPSGTFPTVFPNDPGKLPLVLSNELVHHFSSLGPCQPIALELLNYEFPKKKYPNGNVRSFHENFYHRKIENGRMFVKMWWLSYSPSQDKFFCISCKLFGLPKAKNSFLAKIGSNDYKNIKRTIDSHESWSEHITSEIARGLYQKNMRIDTGILEAANRQIAEKPSSYVIYN
ncbi:zinc finger MYM-type protein 5-like [Acyrthosiphon pisum]|uniref:TTF-type domain-containing protein n=1 Tax=Acyrthosiphon pisum TaxID=7029 RepID=A0A8R2H753_ACYPI|nr:zinc finger MYM-type protein 5-like [Acyrthosiphon pisum]|eukprot:XP_016658975.1 PREDICTED: zinc finger MYM-type protein 5-like [Acyrthosiphon pisum]